MEWSQRQVLVVVLAVAVLGYVLFRHRQTLLKKFPFFAAAKARMKEIFSKNK